MRFAKLLVALFAVVLLAGCAAQKVESTQEPSQEPAQQKSNTTTIAECLGKHYASWNEFDQGIQSGTQIPQSLQLHVDKTIDGYVYDKDVITSFWNRLSQLRVAAEPSKDEKIEGERISFTFDSGKEIIPFRFRTTRYVELSDGTYYAVEETDKVQELVDELKGLVEQEMPKAGTELEKQNDAYFWDANGDGMLEHMWIDVVNNGDEAPSVMNVRVFSEDLDVSDSINGGYSVDRVTLMEDDQGPYVVLDYAAGDYYSHDTPKQCTVRLVGDELKIEDVAS